MKDDNLQVLKQLWAHQNMPKQQMDEVELTGREPAVSSSFSIGTAAQSSIAAAACTAATIGELRGLPQQKISVNIDDAIRECTGYFTLNGEKPDQWAPLSGLYRCRDGWLRVHANFDHHRDRALQSAGLEPGGTTDRAALEAALASTSAIEMEDKIIAAGGACAAVRDPALWDASPQGVAMDLLPLIEIEKTSDAAPRNWPQISSSDQPLEGLNILDLTRILAGPVCGRTLAAYGAQVLLVNSPNLPNIDAIADTSRGKRSALLNLKTTQGQQQIDELLSRAHVFLQGYRPGALPALGLDANSLGQRYPGIICASLSAYGRSGPWSERRGYDSLVQTACGFNTAEAIAMGNNKPQPMPVQILDYASGFLLAYGIQAALCRQAREGGSWHVQVSLARTGKWLRELARQSGGECEADNDTLSTAADYLQTYPSGYGDLRAIPHAAVFSHSQVKWHHPSSSPGSDVACWI